MKRVVCCIGIMLTFALAGTATAKTPDGETPAEETVCSGLTGAAFGLCNAYCEAQDCDVHPRPSCAQLLANFRRITGMPSFPCDNFCGDGTIGTGEECDPPGSLCPSCVCPDPCGDPCVCICSTITEVCSNTCTCEPLRCEESTLPACGGVCPPDFECVPDSTTGECLCTPPPPVPCPERDPCGGTCIVGAGVTGLCQVVIGTDICECLPPPPPPCGLTSAGQCGGLCEAGLECRRSGSAITDCACLPPPPPPPPACDQRQECGGECVTDNNTIGECRQESATAPCLCEPLECLEEGTTGCIGVVERSCCLCTDNDGTTCVNATIEECVTTPGCRLEPGTCGDAGECLLPPPPEPCCPGLQCIPPGVCLPAACGDRAQCGGPCGADLTGNCAPGANGCGCNILSGGG